VVGPPAAVVGRLHELAAVGVDRMIIMGAARAPGREADARAAHHALVHEVLPALH